MQIAFSKMNGAGNDFVLVDNRDDQVSLVANRSRSCVTASAGLVLMA